MIELLFSLPASNGKVKSIFLQLKTIKNEKRSLLNNQQLDDLLNLNADVIPLNNFDANSSIDLWWQDEKRRLNQCQRKPYRKRRKNILNAASTMCSTSSLVDVVNLDSEYSESIAESESDSETNNLLDC